MSARPYDELRFPKRTYVVKRGKLGGLYVRGPRDIKLYLNSRAVPDDVRRANTHLYDARGELRQEARDWWLRKSRAAAGCGRLTPMPVATVDCGATTRELEKARRTVDEVTRKADALSGNVVALRSEVRDLREEAALRVAEAARVEKVDCGETKQRLAAARRAVDETTQKADALADRVVELRSEVRELKTAAAVAAAAAPKPVSDAKLQRELVRARNTVDLMRREIEQLKESDAQARQRRLALTAEDTNRVAALEKRVRDLDFEKERLLRTNAHTVRERNRLKRQTEELTGEQNEARRALARARIEIETWAATATEQRLALQASDARIQSLEASFSTQAADLVSATAERQRLSELLDAERARNGRNSLQSRELQGRVAALDEQVATYTIDLERTHARLLATAAERDAVQTRLDEAQRQLQARPRPSQLTPSTLPLSAPPSYRPTSAPPSGGSLVGAGPAADRRAAEEKRATELRLAREEAAERAAAAETRARLAREEEAARLEREAVERRQREEKARRELATRDLRDTAATGKVRVVARVRPLLSGETPVGIAGLLDAYGRKTGTAPFDDSAYGATASDEFFRQYGFDLQLAQFFESQTEAVIMLYGGSGAGKTYATKYLLKRAVATAHADPRVASVRLCFLDVYKSERNVDVYDLLYHYDENRERVAALPLADTTPYSSLSADERALVDKLRRDAIPRAGGRPVDTGPAWRSKNSCRLVARPASSGTTPEGKQERKLSGGMEAKVAIGDSEAVDRLLDYAARLRIATPTRANRAGSSRSHLFIRVKVEFWDPATHDPRGQASLYLVDLAGTEDYTQYTTLDFKKDRGIKTHLLSEADQKAFAQLKDESKFINSSLRNIEPIVRNAKTHVQGTSRFGPANTFAFERLLEDIITPATQLTVIGALTPNAGGIMTFIDPATGKKREEHEYDVASANTLAFLTRLSGLTTK